VEQLGTRLEHYQLQHSPILYGWKKGGPHNWTSDRSQSTVLKFNRPTNSELHPTMKPVPLLEYLITNSTNENDLVVDAFGGSGSTMMASENMDRVCYTMELEANNCDTIVRRWVNLMTKQQKGIKVTKNGKDITQQKWLYGKATSKAK
jgi:site-specific DNA-methyltransferase (adenine-specific)